MTTERLLLDRILTELWEACEELGVDDTVESELESRFKQAFVEVEADSGDVFA